MNMSKINHMVKILRGKAYHTDDASPNRVAFEADKARIKLTSQEIVYISDNYVYTVVPTTIERSEEA
jgi:hypothetical protein